MVAGCPRNGCGNRSPRPDFGPLGRYYRTSDRHWIHRFRCHRCGHSFSTATANPCFGQKKRQLNESVRLLLASGNSMRRTAMLLGIHRTTVARKLRFLGRQANQKNHRFLDSLENLPAFQFDELETFEHTKYKPLSVVMAVVPKSRKILGFAVAPMPAKGPLAAKAREKYGSRADHRGRALASLLRTLTPHVHPMAELRSDSNPRYPPYVRRYFPHARHIREPGGRGCVVGQGELKALVHDPLFTLNHTFAMLRDNIRRLVRRTWCTTKRADRLADHLAIYAAYHNETLTR